MVSTLPTGAPQDAASADGTHTLYRAAWRWHFYAGLYVIPFLIMLAVTGLTMLWIGVVSGRDGEWIAVTPVNDAPVAVADAASTDEDTAKVFSQADLKGNDTDVDNTKEQLSVTAVSNPTNGSVVRNGTRDFAPT